MAIAEDATTPAVATIQGPATTLATASFSPPSGSLLLAIAAVAQATSLSSITMADSGAHTWTGGPSKFSATVGYGGCKIFYTYLSSAPGSITVTGTYGGATAQDLSLAVRVLTGTNSSQAGAATAATETASTTVGTVSVTTTTTGSKVYGISMSCFPNTALTLNGATSLINSYADTPVGSNTVDWRATNATGTPGATTLGGTWGATCDVAEVLAFEVLPGGASFIARTNNPIRQAVKRSYFY
jgi:hypothetical protein